MSISSRVFCIAAVLGLAILSRGDQALVAVAIIGTVAGAAIYVSMVTAIAPGWITTVEALIVGLVIALVTPGALALLPYLVVLPLIAGMTQGLLGLSLVVAAELSTVVLLPSTVEQLPTLEDRGATIAPWLFTSLGAGLLGAWLRQIGKGPTPSGEDLAYASARRLLGQLRTVARRLSAGLDPVTISSQVLALVTTALEAPEAAIFVGSSGGALSPLAYEGPLASEHLQPTDSLVNECWASAEPCQATTRRNGDGQRHLTGLPLRAGTRMIGVIYISTPTKVPPAALAPLMQEIDVYSVRLDTALAFDEVRSLATLEERRRLAREIHDGVAQDVASLGYFIDDMLSTSETARERAGLTQLRQELTRVVTELRLSIFDLRSDVAAGSLGSALSEYVHQIGNRAGMTVHLTVDESPTRLRGDIETELFRIAQEAITNARKHSRARNLWVDCWVRPPSARLEIRDDGQGLGSGRVDSYGLRIMKERAKRVQADLQVCPNVSDYGESGTSVRVSLGTPSWTAAQVEAGR